GAGGGAGSQDSDGPRGLDAATSDAPSPAAARAPEILPVVLLTVNDQTPGSLGNDKVSGSLRLVVDHKGTLQDLPGGPAAIDSWIGISKHGSSSAYFPQLSFGFSFLDADGSGRKLEMLGMPADSDWDLVACWTDKPCLRNPLAYLIGQQFGRWAPHFRLV